MNDKLPAITPETSPEMTPADYGMLSGGQYLQMHSGPSIESQEDTIAKTTTADGY